MEIPTDRIAQALAAVTALRGRDVFDLAEAELVAAHAAAAHLARLSQIPQAVLAAEIARRSDEKPGGGMARKHGHRNAGGMVATFQGGTGAQARDAIVTGSLFGASTPTETGAGVSGSRWPRIAAAVLAGAISTAQARLLVETLDAMTGADAAIEAKLVSKANHLTLADLTKVCADVKARWDVGTVEAREKRQRAERFLALSEGVDGTVTLHGRLDPASAAPIKTLLDEAVRREFSRKRDAGEGPAQPGEAGRIRLDTLVDLARHGLRCAEAGAGPSTTVIVRIDHEALRTGIGLATCDALDVPLTAGQVRRLAADAQILPVMLGTGSQALDLGYAKRFFTPAQRIALAERDGGCAFCHAPVSWCDAHHIRPVSLGGRSDLANGVLLCTRCHHRIHDDKWEVRATATEVWFTPPAAIDPTRTPRLGGKAALRVELPASAHPPL